MKSLKINLQGYVRIRINGNAIERFFNLCVNHGIFLWDIYFDKENCETNISIREFKKLKPIIRKSHVSIRIVERHGFPFFVHKYKNRKWAIGSVCSAIVLLVWLSSHIWNIKIEGNMSQTNDVIMEYLQLEGITYGSIKYKIDCKALGEKLRHNFDSFSWASVELKGTSLNIHVREGVNAQQPQTLEGATSIAASCDGTLESVYVRKGRLLVSPGTEIKKGQILVSGALPVYNDDGVIQNWNYTNADADIVVRTEEQYQDKAELKTRKKEYTGREKQRIILELFGVPLALPFFNLNYDQYDIETDLTQLHLFENFYLPLYCKNVTAREYVYRDILYTKEEAQKILTENFQEFMKNLAVKGVQIFENNVKIEWNEKSAIATGTVILYHNQHDTVLTDLTEEEASQDEYG